MAGCGEHILRSPSMEPDFVAQSPICDRAAKLITEAKTIHVTNHAGTDVTFSVEGSKGNSHSCIVAGAGL